MAADMFDRALWLVEALFPSSLRARVCLVPEQADPFPATTRGAVPNAILRCHELEEARIDTPSTDSESAGQLVVGTADLGFELVRLEPDGLKDALQHNAALSRQGVLGVAEGGVDHGVVNLELSLFRLMRLGVPVLRGSGSSRRRDRVVMDRVPDLRDWKWLGELYGVRGDHELQSVGGAVIMGLVCSRVHCREREEPSRHLVIAWSLEDPQTRLPRLRAS